MSPVSFIIQCMAAAVRFPSLRTSEKRRLMTVFYTTETCSFLDQLTELLCIDRLSYLLLRI